MHHSEGITWSFTSFDPSGSLAKFSKAICFRFRFRDSFGPLQIFSLVTFSLLSTGIAAAEEQADDFGHLQRVYERPDRIIYDGWDDMCRHHDCSVAPIGYQTIDFNGSRYYFPLPELLGPVPGQRTGRWVIRSLGYEEFDENGKLLRVYEPFGQGFGWYSGTLRKLADWYEIEDLPAIHQQFWKSYGGVGYPSPPIHSTVPVDGRSLFRVLDGARNPREGEEVDPSTISPDLVADITQTFDIILPLEHWRRRLISKSPIAFGRYVYADCRGLCDFTALHYGNSKDRDFLGSGVFGVSYRELLGRGCVNWSIENNDYCRDGWENLDQITDLYVIIDRVFAAAKQTPKHTWSKK